jgi:hypothetical protein
MDLEIIKSIEGWIVPNNVSEVIYFMGIAGYHRIFIKGFLEISHPMTSFQNNGVRFEWTPDCERIFLNILLTSESILRIVDLIEDFIVCTDGCKEGLGGVLSQNGHVIFYESIKLKDNERQYVTRDLELASIVHALKMWIHYLMGKRFELRTDHSGMKYLFGQPTLNARKSRWLEFINEYDFKINHIKGKENKVADALSRRMHEMHATTISMYKSNLQDRILEAAKSDPHYTETKEKIYQGNLQQKIQYYELREDGILMYKGIVYMPNSQELKI